MLQLLLLINTSDSACCTFTRLNLTFGTAHHHSGFEDLQCFLQRLDATIIDVRGIEVQVPSLSSPGYSVWILISRGHEKFVNEIHRHNSDIVNYSSLLRAMEDKLNDVCLETSKPAVVDHGQGSQDSNNVKTKVEPSSMHLETVASTIRVAPTSSKSSSCGSGGSSNPTSLHLKKSNVHSREERDPQERQNLDFYSWMPEKQEGFI